MVWTNGLFASIFTNLDLLNSIAHGQLMSSGDPSSTLSFFHESSCASLCRSQPVTDYCQGYITINQLMTVYVSWVHCINQLMTVYMSLVHCH